MQRIAKIKMFSRFKKHSLWYILFRLYEIFHIVLLKYSSLCFFKIKLNLYGIQCGKNVQVYGNIVIRGPGTVSIGDDVILVSSAWYSYAAPVSHGVRLRTFMQKGMSDNKIIIEDGVSLNGTSITARSRTIRVGKNTMIAPNCVIMDSDFHIPWPPFARNINPGVQYDQDVNIGENVWIGVGCTILKGVFIGDNTVIGAGSVVTKSIPANALAAGNPARVIKFYSNETLE